MREAMVYIKETLRIIFIGLFMNAVLFLLAPIMYPLAFYLRDFIRTGIEPAKRNCLPHRKYMRWLWYFLDDSIYISKGREYNTDIHGDGWQPDNGDSLLSSYYWSAWRNKGVNYWNWTAVGRLEGYRPYPPYFNLGEYTLGDRTVTRIYTKFNLFGKVISCGYSFGSGRFEFKGR